jgi:hypothetical protein
MRNKTIGLMLALALAVTFAMPVSYGMPAIGTGRPVDLTPDEEAVIDSIDEAYAWDQLEYLSSLGEKTAGSDEEERAQRYVFNELADNMSFDDVLWETFPVANWEHGGTTVLISSHGYEELPATTYGDAPSIWGLNDGVPYSYGNKDDGKTLEAEVVDVGYGTRADFEAVGDLEGAIALIHRDDNTQGWPNTPVADAANHNASAAMFYGYFTGADHPEGIKQDSVFSRIPSISISPNSAARIQELLEDGPVTLEVSGEVNFYPESESVNVAAVLEGTTKADEYVVISGHIDTWWNGSFDDCSSIAVVLEMARLFSEMRESGTYVNERTLVFCSVGSEESGGPNGTWFNWLIGSYEFVCAHPDIMEGLVMELNIDGGSFPKVDGKVWLEVSNEVVSFALDAIADLSYSNVLSCYTPVWTWTDAWSFAGKGGGTAVEMVWGAGFDPYYHTQLDTIEIQSEEMLTMVLKLTALMAHRAVGALVLPLDLVAACDWANQNLAQERSMVQSQRESTDAAIAALRDLRDLALAVNERAAEIEEMHATAKSPGKKKVAQAMADELNRAIIDARRILIPYSMGEGGMMASWEPMLRPHQHATDYVAVSAAILALENGDVGSAISALEGVRSMEWGKFCGRDAYIEVLGQMMDCDQYWGDDFDQAQAYVDVQGVYLGLGNGTMSPQEAMVELQYIIDEQLVPWFEADVLVLAWAFGQSAEVLAEVLG